MRATDEQLLDRLNEMKNAYEGELEDFGSGDIDFDLETFSQHVRARDACDVLIKEFK